MAVVIPALERYGLKTRGVIPEKKNLASITCSDVLDHLGGRLLAIINVAEPEFAAATAAHEALRLHELGTLYGELHGQLQERLDLWAELAA